MSCVTKRRTVFILLVIFACSFILPAFGEGFLPSLDEELGVKMPFISAIIQKEPANSGKMPFISAIIKKGLANGGKKVDIRCEEYADVSFGDYTKIGRCFGRSGFSLEEKSFANDTIRLVLKKEDTEIQAEYDIVKGLFKVWYPKYFTEDKQCYSLVSADSCIFPEIEEFTGAILPRLSSVLKREPVSWRKVAGKLVEEYDGFSEEDYKAVSVYLQEQGCSVIGYEKKDKLLIINLEKNGVGFTLRYNPESETAVMEYNSDSYIEPVTTSTPVPTATPVPTVNPDDYNTYAAVFVSVVKSTRNNPDSLQVHSIRVMEYKGDNYIVIAFSAMNGFGGYTRDTYSFKFSTSGISLSGNSSDYDMYEKHRKEFSLVATLDVNAVLRLVK